MRRFIGAVSLWWLVYMHLAGQADWFPWWLKLGLLMVSFIAFYKDFRSI